MPQAALAPRPEIAPDVAPNGGPTLDLSRPVGNATVLDELKLIAQQSGLPPVAAAQACLKLAFGPGKMTFKDYVKLRLFDPAYQGGDPSRFVSARRNRDLNVTVNYRHDWMGLVSNKVAALSYLAAYGLPVAPFSALYLPGLGATAGPAPVLRDPAAIERFLATAAYPLFGKPAEGVMSLGSAALAGFDAAKREVIFADGRRASAAQLAADIVANYAAGYVFQPLLRPDPAIAAICGPRLATVRFVTLLTQAGPVLFRAAWKIPAGDNHADNYWRPGNLLAQVDLESGRVLRATSGAGVAAVEHARHPDSDAALVGAVHPRWAEMTALAIEGARVMRHMPLIGWDIACAAEGPMIMEMNESPDLFLVQFADRRGVLDETFDAFVAYQARRAAEWAKEAKAASARL